MVAQRSSGTRRTTPKPVEIPARRPWQARSRRPSGRLVWLHVEADRYEVRRGRVVLGFVEAAAGGYVVLAGTRYDRAAAIARVPCFDDAVAALEAHDAANSPRASG